ncbi:MAG TPA: polysaccharide deacetylase family protein [Verrucomicrobiae bacterium]|nr:polysaccharide deacetylase family protein [Verrucomicrobiae bacterium]
MAACIKSAAAGVALLAMQLGVTCAPASSSPQSTVSRQSAARVLQINHAPATVVFAELSPPKPALDCAVRACLALTFDDGPGEHTAALLDTLAAHQASATFFMLGSQAVKYPNVVRRVAHEGHEIGNHSWGHANFGPMQQVHIAADIAHAQQSFKDLGVTPRLMRPPYGIHTPAVQQATEMSLAYWNIDPKDWDAKDPHALAQAVIALAKPGGIVVMHDIKSVTVAAATEFVATLKQHYQLVTVSQLMGLSLQSPKADIFGRH